MGNKKLVCCLIALALACTALAGCSSQEASLSALASKDVAISPQPTATLAPTPEPTATPAPTSTAAPVSAFRPGELSENGYTSTWLGLQFTAPKGMIMMTEEQMLQAAQAGQQTLYGGDAQELLEQSGLSTSYEMLCLSPEGNSVNILVETTPIALTENQYLTLSQTQLENALGTQGEVTFGETQEREIGGVLFTGLPYRVRHVQEDGTEVQMEIIAFVKCIDVHTVVMTVTSVTPDGAETALSGFSPLGL